MFRPRRLAVVGASPNPASVGHRVLRSILDDGFPGAVHPIHPTASEVEGLRAYPSVLAVPGALDLAVIAVPAAAAEEVVVQCAQKGVGGIIMLTAGFGEEGPEGAAREARLRDLVTSHGIRLVGPNCLGVIDAHARLRAVFAEMPVDGGHVALMTQSGALGIALAERSHALGLGLGKFVSMGNKLDVSGNDLLLAWQDDPDVKVILAHLESIGNPRNFLRIARELTRRKPIVLVKGGRTAAGARAAGSHTGALMQPDTLVSALMHQAGVLRADSVEHLFDIARAVATQPPLRGPRVAVVTNSGGPAILLADSLPPGILELAQLDSRTKERCAALLPKGATVANPLDLLAGASPENLAKAVGFLLEDPNVDAVVAMATPLAADDRVWGNAIQQSCVNAGKPVVAVLFGRNETSKAFQQLAGAGIPTYTYPENAARALAALRTWGRIQERPHDAPVVQPKQATLPAPRGDGWLHLADALDVASAIGLNPVASERLAVTDRAASPTIATQLLNANRAATAFAVKADGAGLVHKTDAGAVAINVKANELEAAVGQVLRNARAAGFAPDEIVVQAMAPPGVDVLLGAVRDPRFGPVVSVGLGGIHVEVLRDVAFRLAPVTLGEAHDMVGDLQAFSILRGTRGQPASDVDALAKAIAALGAFMDANPHVLEFEVNPLRVHSEGGGVSALDARARLRTAEPAT